MVDGEHGVGRLYSHVRADLVGCVFLGRGVLTPHLVFQLASMSDSLYLNWFVGRIWRLLIDACLSGQVYSSKCDRGVVERAVCPPSSPGPRRGPSGVGIKTQV